MLARSRHSRLCHLHMQSIQVRIYAWPSTARRWRSCPRLWLYFSFLWWRFRNVEQSEPWFVCRYQCSALFCDAGNEALLYEARVHTELLACLCNRVTWCLVLQIWRRPCMQVFSLHQPWHLNDNVFVCLIPCFSIFNPTHVVDPGEVEFCGWLGRVFTADVTYRYSRG